MDIPRTPPNRRRQRLIAGAIAVLALAAVTWGLARLEPAAPEVEKATLWIDSVRRGPMLREVRGTGSLVPEEIRWIAAASQGRVERLLVQAGAPVAPETVLVELDNPELELAARDAELQLRAAEAELASVRVRLDRDALDLEAVAAQVEAAYEEAKLQVAANERLAKEGLLPEITLEVSRIRVRELATRNELERRRLASRQGAAEAQLVAQQARVDQLRALAALRRREFENLQVRAGIAGVLQQIPVEPGQLVTPGTVLARVAEPSRLKAELRIAETQAKDIQLGQPAAIDTRNGVVAGRVARIDPAVENGTVTVDVTLSGALPQGARPDLTVDGTIELEKLADVLFVGRPAFGQPDSTVQLFRLDAEGRAARRATVRLGKASVHQVQVLEGLAVGDRVILSDMSTWDAFDRVRLE